MGLTRRPDWPAVLAHFVRHSRERPFAWGSHDCALFAAHWVDAATGSRISAEFEGRYSTRAGAQDIIAEFGGLGALATHFLGEPIDISFARRGDVALFSQPSGETLGVVIGLEVVSPGATGWVARPVFECDRAWRVG